MLAPKLWAGRCAPPPALYYIHERLWIEPEPDALEEYEYVGGVIVVVDHVPEKVTEPMLRQWLNAGLDEHTEGLVPTRMKLKQLLDQEETTQESIKGLVHFNSENWDGNAIDKKRERVRRLNYTLKMVQAQIARVQAQLDLIMDNLATQAHDDGAGLYTVARSVRHADMRTSAWDVSFADTKQARKLAYWATHKYDWRDYRLALDTLSGGCRLFECVPRCVC